MKNSVNSKNRFFLTVLILLLILIALYFNIIALRLPFISVKHPLTSIEFLFKHTYSYSLYNFTYLLEEKYNYYLGAKFTIIFSVIFPFIRLLFLSIVCIFIKSFTARMWIVGTLKCFNKLTFLGFFVTVIYFIIQSVKSSLVITVEPGVYYFLLAMIIGSICTMLVDSLLVKTDSCYSNNLKDYIYFQKNDLFPVERRLILTLLFIGFIFFIFAVICNDIHISTSLFNLRHINSIISCWYIIQLRSNSLALFSAIVLLVIPFLFYVNQFIFWCTSYHLAFHIRMAKLINKLSNFMMLDVLFLSLFLYAIEAISKMKMQEGNVLRTEVLVLVLFIAFFLPVLIKLYCLFRYLLQLKISNKRQD